MCGFVAQSGHQRAAVRGLHPGSSPSSAEPGRLGDAASIPLRNMQMTRGVTSRGLSENTGCPLSLVTVIGRCAGPRETHLETTLEHRKLRI